MSGERKLRGNKRKVKAYLGLGSNEGNRLSFVQQAMQLLKDVSGVTVLECSSLYEAEPVNDNDQTSHCQWFVNAVVAIETSHSPEELLEICQDIERRLTALGGEFGKVGRERGRIIDLDILFYGDLVFASPNLTIPHPKVHKRAFALVPLLEIAPDIHYPGMNKSVAQLHEELPEPEQVYLYGTREAEAD